MKKIMLLFVSIAILSLGNLNATKIIVDQNGAGQFTTIQEGVNAASAGDTVIVWPGVYTPQAQIIVNKNILLQGSGYENTMIVASIGDLLKITSGKVKWFMITSTAGTGVTMDGNCILTNCIVKSCTGDGISAKNEARIFNCVVTNCGSKGIRCISGQIYVSNCISRNNTSNGFHVNGGCGMWTSYNNGSYSNDCCNQWINGYQGTIDVDPNFISSTNYHITTSSPCSNTGLPNLFDPDGSVSDMGYFGGPDAPIYPVVYEMTISPNGSNVNVNAKARANY